MCVMFLVPAVIVRCCQHADGGGSAAAQARCASRPRPPVVVSVRPVSRRHPHSRPRVQRLPGRTCRRVGEPRGGPGVPRVLGHVLGAGAAAEKPAVREGLPDALPAEA
jgi:hypothetical protein